MFHRGGRGNSKLGPVDEDSMDFGEIQLTYGVCVPRTIDGSPSAKPVTAAVGCEPDTSRQHGNVCRAMTFTGTGDRPLGPSIHTVAKTLLASLGILPKKPDVCAPGSAPPLTR